MAAPAAQTHSFESLPMYRALVGVLSVMLMGFGLYFCRDGALRLLSHYGVMGG